MQRHYINPGVIAFDAPIEQTEKEEGTGGWITFPYDLKETYGVGNLIPVMVMFDDIEYRGSIAKMGPEPMLLIRNDVYQKLGKKRGDIVHVTVTLDDTPRKVEIPPQLAEVLKNNPHIKEKFDTFSYTHQKEWVQYITQAKQEETKERRINKFLEDLKNK